MASRAAVMLVSVAARTACVVASPAAETATPASTTNTTTTVASSTNVNARCLGDEGMAGVRFGDGPSWGIVILAQPWRAPFGSDWLNCWIV
jgi:hypothetical protein